MFKPNSQINHNNTNYYVVLDHIIAGASMVNDESHFIAKQQQITPRLEISFINDYRAINHINPVGFWQTILSNHPFDYTDNFKYKFSIGSEMYLISFDVNKGVLIHVDSSLVDIDSFADIEIDFDGFTDFEIIQTQKQKAQDNRAWYQRLILKHVIFYGLLVSSIFSYYQLQKSDFVQTKQQLLTLQTKSFDLRTSIDNLNNRIITTNTSTQQAHVKNLLYVLASGINIQKTEIDLTQPLAVMVINLDDLDMLKHLAKANNITLSIINTDFVNNTSEVAWKVRSRQWGLSC